MSDNTLLDFDELPRFADICPDDVSTAVDTVLAAAQQTADAVTAVKSPSWETICAPLEAADENIARVWNQVEHMHAVMSTPVWRTTYRENLEKISSHTARMGQHEGVYQQLLTLAKSPIKNSKTRQKIITDTLRNFQLSGIALSDEKKATFRRNGERLAALSATFAENLLDATNDKTLKVVREEDLGDMPPDLKQAARQAAENTSGFCFTLQQPSYVAFMQYSPARNLRRELYHAYNTRASEFGPTARDNSPHIAEILALRAKQATLLGFDDYSHLALQTRMADTPEKVLNFLSDLVNRARPAAEKELQDMRAFAATELGIDDLQPWDVNFVTEHMCRHRFDFSDAELRPYLRTDRVLKGLFTCAEKLFGVRVSTASASLWLPEAQYFKLQDRNDKNIGGLYLDLYTRRNKRGGAWMADALSRCRRHGALQLPVAHVTCNFAPPEAGGTALLNWDEAVTLFHEFGHALHHLLTEVEEFSASGISGVEWDAVELPSQFMENFIWDWRVLEPMTAHVDTGKPMPRALFDKAWAARRFQSGLRLVRQLEFALFDLLLHRGTPQPFMAVLDKARQQTAVLTTPEWNRFPCGFAHIFAGGYAAGYYSYLWAEVLAADAFAMFTESGNVMNANLGACFRREVLGVGGSRAAMKSFTAFRGRAPNPAALLKHYGLDA